MRGLVLAEKPSLMRAIEGAYKDGGPFPFDLDFAAFHGHLMRQAEPAEYNPKWAPPYKAEDLPLIPEPFKYLPDDVPSVNKIMTKIRNGKYDFLVNACDAEREGEHIFWSFYEANNLKLPVKRLWCSTTLKADLVVALHNLRDASDFQHLREASFFRAQFDWLAGMNFSRAISLKTHSTANIGRVVTPTLKMVVDRELEIQNFVPQSFYEIVVKMKKGDDFLGAVLVPPELKQTRFSDEKAAKAAQAGLGKTGSVESVTAKRTVNKAPTLYSTTELQKDANKYYKFRASKTDSVAQDLYEAGLISYPRTSCRFLPTSMVAEIPKLLKPLEKFPELAIALKMATPAAIAKATTGKDYIDDAKLTDHHAIIPTTAVFDPSTLGEDQKKIYLLVAKRFLSIFLPPYVVESTTVIVDSNGQKVKAAGKTVVDMGFSILYPYKGKDVILPPLKKGDEVAIAGSSIREGSTKPPDRYTDKTLLDAMANAGKFVSSAEQRAILREAEGIGTSATRSDILKKLESSAVCRVDSKGVYYPTGFGMALVDAIKDREITSPSITAKWEEKLRDVQDHGHPEKFKAEMLAYIKEETLDILNKVNADLRGFSGKEIGKCPLCGQPVMASKAYFRCAKYKADKDPCTFIVRREARGINLTEADMQLMLDGKPTKVKKLTAKDGHEYSAALILKDGKVAPSFAVDNKKQGTAKSENVHTKKGICKCPVCGTGEVFAAKSYYICTNKSGGCGFSIPLVKCGTPLLEDQVKDLIAGKTLGPMEFLWSTGRRGLAEAHGEIYTDKNGIKRFGIKFNYLN